MAEGYIDASSVFGVMAAMTYQEPEQWPKWTLVSAAEVTCLLVNDNSIGVVRGMGSPTNSLGLYDHTMRVLASVVSQPKLSRANKVKARNEVEGWAKEHSIAVKKAYKKLQKDDSFHPWLNWCIANAYVDHSTTLHGLFDHEFIPELSAILNCSQAELQDIWTISRDPKRVEYWSRKRPDSDDFRLATDAYVISNLLRGRYHVAEAADQTIMHHPVRDIILPAKKTRAAFAPTNTEKYFTSLLLASALAERNVENRLTLWADNVIKARKAIRTGEIELVEKSSDTLAEGLAKSAAKKIDVCCYSRRTVAAFDVLSSTLVGGFLYFVLSQWSAIPGWAGLPIKPIVDSAMKYKTGKSLGDKAASKFYLTEARLHDLANAVPGRMRGTWR